MQARGGHEERWRDIDGFDGRYQISDYGRVFSKFKNGHTKVTSGYTANAMGYRKMRLYRDDGSATTRYVHQLVAEAFVDNPFGRKVINHIDSNPANNHYSNLEWCTQAENMQHAKAANRMNRIGCIVRDPSTDTYYLSIRDAASVAGIKPNSLLYGFRRHGGNYAGMELIATRGQIKIPSL